jgi:hypothetical protein
MPSTDFDKLSLEQKVSFINSQLQKDMGLSVTKLLKKFGIKENTMKSQLRRGNYKFNEEIRKYEKYQNDTKVLIEEENSSNATIEKVETIKSEKIQK